MERTASRQQYFVYRCQWTYGREVGNRLLERAANLIKDIFSNENEKYGFYGWSTESDGTGNIYQPNDTITQLEARITKLEKLVDELRTNAIERTENPNQKTDLEIFEQNGSNKEKPKIYFIEKIEII